MTDEDVGFPGSSMASATIMEYESDQPNESAICQFNKALAKAQGEFPPIPKTAIVRVSPRGGGGYTFAYAPLEEVLKAVIPVLSANGFALTQSVGYAYNHTTVVTTLAHEGGHSTQSVVPLVLDGEAKGPQAMGSALSYARRYGVTLALGVATEEDDDGGIAEGNDMQRKAVAYIDKTQIANITALLGLANKTEAKLCEYYKIPDLSKMPASLYDGVIATLNRHIDKIHYEQEQPKEE